MLTGPELGAAIEAARIAKGVSKKKLADDFQVKPPSVQGWVKYGRIDKSKLMELIAYFGDVVDHKHWGLHPSVYGITTKSQLKSSDASPVVSDDEVATILLGRLKEARSSASPRSQIVLNRMIGMAETGSLTDAHWDLIDGLLTELARK